MKQKDHTQKTLEQYDDIFADILNVLLFHGKYIVRPEDLTDATTFSQYKADRIVYGQDRDVAKYWKNGRIQIALVGLENQTDPDRDMPLRVMGYDGAAYRNQLNRGRGEGKQEERYPVVTLILYFGHRQRWGSRRSLKDCFSIPSELKEFVSDYRINVFEIAYLERETIDLFTSDFWILADYCYQMRTTGKYKLPHKEALHPHEVFDALSAFSRDPRFREQYNAVAGEKEAKNMPIDSWFDQVVPEAEARGEARSEARVQQLFAAMEKEGRTEEFLAAMKDRDLLHKLYQDFNIEVEDTADSGESV
ncbi:MAG: Rpn family recombination-promoting nuclease/putative transposase [Firmicutes bacterium]|nr:Rpn family recombination-promoting nuclease/putative transposase [Bacillota bacterium]